MEFELLLRVKGTKMTHLSEKELNFFCANPRIEHMEDETAENAKEKISFLTQNL